MGNEYTQGPGYITIEFSFKHKQLVRKYSKKK